ncbi:MAG: hypothetical protein M3491_13515 [Actinomycetota bacterium]|nr:hypothetical protein [Actinomycetota bacterium]
MWYFGEDTKEYENDKVTSTKGSWEAGVDAAKPGTGEEVERVEALPCRRCAQEAR